MNKSSFRSRIFVLLSLPNYCIFEAFMIAGDNARLFEHLCCCASDLIPVKGQVLMIINNGKDGHCDASMAGQFLLMMIRMVMSMSGQVLLTMKMMKMVEMVAKFTVHTLHSGIDES